MRKSRMIRRCLSALTCGLPGLAVAAPPELLDDRFELTLFAEQPAVRTPTGCTVDSSGRLLVAESHTHFRPEGYEGPEKDRILALSDLDADGKADKVEVFWEGGEHVMSIRADWDETVYVASRSEIFSLKHSDGDGKADKKTPLVELETTGKYPHNGLCGLALCSPGYIYFGLGENLGHPYQLIGSDGRRYSGGGEGGSIYLMRLDGTEMERIATGFWNPFGITVAGNSLFAVDNDPDSRPPNRLLHVVARGDYGYQYRYGRSGNHPLQAWDGELPGTLPMLAGTGEAACAVTPVGDALWVTSWGHHRIESHRLRTEGASFAATMETVVRGGPDFRPVDLATAPDGSIYFTDWVDGSYPVHGKGRVWKLTPKEPVETAIPHSRKPVVGMANLAALAGDPDPFVRAATAPWLAATGGGGYLAWGAANPKGKVAILSVTRWHDPKSGERLLERSLADPSPAVRLAAVRWIADEKRVEFADEIRNLLAISLHHPRLFGAAAATLKRLGAEVPAVDRESLLLEVVEDSERPADERAAALRSIPPDSKKLPIATFEALIATENPPLQEAAVWHLSQRTRKDAPAALAKAAADPDIGSETRRDAELHLPPPPDRAIDHRGLTLEEWAGEIALHPGDPRAGRRVFFSEHLGACARCHTHGGYGRRAGPDLTAIGRRETTAALLTSILEPGREVAPRYRAWMLERWDGQLDLGLPVETTGRHGGGAQTFMGTDGQLFEIPLADLKARHPWVTSLMPAKLDRRLTIQEMRDLIAFLGTGER